MQLHDIAQRLKSLGYERLFLSLDGAELDALWRQPGIAEPLDALTADTSADTEARFLAAEALARKQPNFVSTHAARLAPIYVGALRNSKLANIWGMPGELDGAAGLHLVGTGTHAVDQLIPLLDDTRQITYSGSEEATVGNSFRYRVKDFAAFFIHRILGLPYTVRKTPSERDMEIERLRSALRRDKVV
jgi:hypothetical protein